MQQRTINNEDAEEMTSTRKRGAYKIYNEFKTYQDLKAATENHENFIFIVFLIFYHPS